MPKDKKRLNLGLLYSRKLNINLIIIKEIIHPIRYLKIIFMFIVLFDDLKV